jgi:small subunit ribosomal protein S2
VLEGKAAAPQAATVREEDFAEGDTKATTRRAPRKPAAKKADDAPAAAEEAPAAE